MAQPSFIPNVWAAPIHEQLRHESTVLSALTAGMPKPTRWQRLRSRIHRATLRRFHAWVHRNCDRY